MWIDVSILHNSVVDSNDTGNEAVAIFFCDVIDLSILNTNHFVCGEFNLNFDIIQLQIWFIVYYHYCHYRCSYSMPLSMSYRTHLCWRIGRWHSQSFAFVYHKVCNGRCPLSFRLHPPPPHKPHLVSVISLRRISFLLIDKRHHWNGFTRDGITTTKQLFVCVTLTSGLKIKPSVGLRCYLSRMYPFTTSLPKLSPSTFLLFPWFGRATSDSAHDCLNLNNKQPLIVRRAVK